MLRAVLVLQWTLKVVQTGCFPVNARMLLLTTRDEHTVMNTFGHASQLL